MWHKILHWSTISDFKCSQFINIEFLMIWTRVEVPVASLACLLAMITLLIQITFLYRTVPERTIADSGDLKHVRKTNLIQMITIVKDLSVEFIILL